MMRLEGLRVVDRLCNCKDGECWLDKSMGVSIETGASNFDQSRIRNLKQWMIWLAHARGTPTSTAL